MLHPCTLPSGFSCWFEAEIVQKGENKSAAHSLIHPAQQGSQLKDVGNA